MKTLPTKILFTVCVFLTTVLFSTSYFSQNQFSGWFAGSNPAAPDAAQKAAFHFCLNCSVSYNDVADMASSNVYDRGMG